MLVWSYAPAVAALWVFHRWANPGTFVLALVVVSMRMNALFVVAHESWHYNLFRSRKLNEIAGAIFAAWPTVMPYVHNRTSHWNHHRHVGTERDPDSYAWAWKDDERGLLARELFFTATGLGYAVRIARLVFGLQKPPPAPGRPPRPGMERAAALREIPRLLLVHLVIFSIFWKTMGPLWYFPLWLFPALGPYPAITGLREFLEHRRGALIVYRAGPIGRFVFGCFNFHLHAYHHACAAAPWFTLPEYRERALRKVPSIVTMDGYFGELFSFMVGRSCAPELEHARAPEPLPAGDRPLGQRGDEAA
jgi:fatty acid desaturase